MNSATELASIGISFYDEATKLQMAAWTQLKNGIKELSKKLKEANAEKKALLQRIDALTTDKERLAHLLETISMISATQEDGGDKQDTSSTIQNKTDGLVEKPDASESQEKDTKDSSEAAKNSINTDTIMDEFVIKVEDISDEPETPEIHVTPSSSEGESPSLPAIISVRSNWTGNAPPRKNIPEQRELRFMDKLPSMLTLTDTATTRHSGYGMSGGSCTIVRPNELPLDTRENTSKVIYDKETYEVTQGDKEFHTAGHLHGLDTSEQIDFCSEVKDAQRDDEQYFETTVTILDDNLLHFGTDVPNTTKDAHRTVDSRNMDVEKLNIKSNPRDSMKPLLASRSRDAKGTTHGSTTSMNEFLCPHCHRRYRHRHNLFRHVRCQHEIPRRYTCQLCLRSYSRRDNLLRHSCKPYARRVAHCMVNKTKKGIPDTATEGTSMP